MCTKIQWTLIYLWFIHNNSVLRLLLGYDRNRDQNKGVLVRRSLPVSVTFSFFKKNFKAIWWNVNICLILGYVCVWHIIFCMFEMLSNKKMYKIKWDHVPKGPRSHAVIFIMIVEWSTPGCWWTIMAIGSSRSCMSSLGLVMPAEKDNIL